jgi:EmrB/QacA subfamily drug resistance transporter
MRNAQGVKVLRTTCHNIPLQSERKPLGIFAQENNHAPGVDRVAPHFAICLSTHPSSVFPDPGASGYGAAARGGQPRREAPQTRSSVAPGLDRPPRRQMVFICEHRHKYAPRHSMGRPRTRGCHSWVVINVGRCPPAKPSSQNVVDEEIQLTFDSARGRWVILATVLGSGIAAIDATVVGIALPAIGREFHTGVADLQWVVTGYLLTLAAFLLLGGSLGDRFGRRRIFSIGVIWFAVASAACGLAPSAPFLIVMRALQGVGGALLMPGSLAILEASFSPDDRARAIGAWSGLGGVATAAGPLLGGYLISAASWRWVFYINLPMALVVLLVTSRHVPESRDPNAARHLDLPGAGTAVVGLGGLTYALIEGPALGWKSPTVLALLIVAVATLLLFYWVERRSSDPMLPLAMFKQRQFSATNAVTFAVYAALSGALFLFPVALQVVSGYSPLQAGLALMPLTVIMLALSARSGRLATRIGPRLQMSVGPIIVGAGLALLSTSTDGSNYFIYVLPAVVIFGFGLAVTVAPLTATAMGSAPSAHSGVASAVNNDVARVAGLVAVAVLPALAGITGRAYLHPSELAAGFRTAVFIAGALSAAGGVLAALTITNPPRVLGAPPDDTHCLHCGLDAPPLDLAVTRGQPEGPAAID